MFCEISQIVSANKRTICTVHVYSSFDVLNATYNFMKDFTVTITVHRLYHSAAVQTFVLVTALYNVFLVFTVTMRFVIVFIKRT